VWFSADGNRAVLLAQTLAAASDIDAQKSDLELCPCRLRPGAAGSEARLLATGPGVFSVASRERIRADALRLSLLATALISAMLLALYRSLRVLGLGLLPVASGALAGVAAVSLAFGAVHGITLAFGVTLIGEAVDYAIYFFTQSAPGASPSTTFERLWPTLRLGMLTSIFGFSAMLFSRISPAWRSSDFSPSPGCSSRPRSPAGCCRSCCRGDLQSRQEARWRHAPSPSRARRRGCAIRRSSCWRPHWPSCCCARSRCGAEHSPA
jgi:hypothetical protein